MAEEKKGNQPELEGVEEVKAGKKRGFDANQLESTLGDGWMKNRKLITGALIGVFVIIGGVFWWQSQKQQKELDAQAAAATTFRYFEMDSTQKALNADANRVGLPQLAEQFGGTPTGNIAHYMSGLSYLDKKQPDQALEHFEEYDENGSMVSASHYSGIAAAHEQKGDFIAAAEAYVKASDIQPNDFTTPFFLQEAGRCYEQAGDNAKAKEIYETIKTEYPNSQQGRSIEKYIARVNVAG